MKSRLENLFLESMSTRQYENKDALIRLGNDSSSSLSLNTLATSSKPGFSEPTCPHPIATPLTGTLLKANVLVASTPDE